MTPRDALHAALRARYGPVGVPDEAMGWEVWPCPVCGIDSHNPLHVRDDGRAHCDWASCGADAAMVFDALDVPDESRGVVVPQTRNTTTTTRSALGDGRRRAEAHIRPVDMFAALARPPKPVCWRLDRFVQDGALTILAAKGGAGKSWIGMAACQAVTEGGSVGAIGAEQGRAVYVDGEMGEDMMVDRFRAAGLDADAFDSIDATGLNLGDEVAVEALTDHLRPLGANLIVLDSLRRLAPGKRENESDDIAPMVSRLAVMARDLDAGVLLLHHSGHAEDRFLRGSSAILDQADAVFGLSPRGDTLELSADPNRGGKMRMARTPEDRYLKLAIGSGVVVAEASIPTTTTPPAKPRAAEEVMGAIAATLGAAARPMTRTDVARAVGRDDDNKSFRKAWGDLRDAGRIVQGSRGWSLSPSESPRGEVEAAAGFDFDTPAASAFNGEPANVRACRDKGHEVRPHHVTGRPTCVVCSGVGGLFVGEVAA